MLKRLFLFLASVMLGVGASAAPAQAAINGCPESGGYFCLYQDLGYTNGRWQVSSAVSNTCINLSGSSYTTGSTVYDSAEAVQITAGPSGTRWLIYAWAGCNTGGGWRYYNGFENYSNFNLNWETAGLPSPQDWGNNIASVKRCTILVNCPSGVF